MADEKVCSECGQIKPIADFYWIKATNKPRSECKKCTGKQIKRSQLKHPKPKIPKTDLDRQKRSDYMKEYTKKNKEKFAAYRKQFTETHPNYFKDYRKKQNEE